MQGFELGTQKTKVAIVIKRLAPSARREDLPALTAGAKKMIDRYGFEIVKDALVEMLEDFPIVRKLAIDNLPKDIRQLMYDESIAFIAQMLEESGLRLEDHLRYSDRGVAITKKAQEVIMSTGYPDADDFQGNESIKGMGIDRDRWVHPLSEQHGGDEDGYVNSWMFASIGIVGANGWGEMEADPERCRQTVKECVSRVAPTADVDKLLWRSRYCDRTLMKLVCYAEEGFQAIARSGKTV